MENCGKVAGPEEVVEALQVELGELADCSGCPGDYEDPDRTAGEEFEELLEELELSGLPVEDLVRLMGGDVDGVM